MQSDACIVIAEAQRRKMIVNFVSTMPTTRQAVKAIDMFKDNYTLDFINVEDIAEEYESVDERVLERLQKPHVTEQYLRSLHHHDLSRTLYNYAKEKRLM